MVTKVKCPYSEKCSEVNKLCETCRHNKEISYYEPRDGLYWWEHTDIPTWTITGDDLSSPSFYERDN